MRLALRPSSTERPREWGLMKAENSIMDDVLLFDLSLKNWKLLAVLYVAVRFQLHDCMFRNDWHHWYLLIFRDYVPIT